MQTPALNEFAVGERGWQAAGYLAELRGDAVSDFYQETLRLSILASNGKECPALEVSLWIRDLVYAALVAKLWPSQQREAALGLVLPSL